jgi:hypothetical protein
MLEREQGARWETAAREQGLIASVAHPGSGKSRESTISCVVLVFSACAVPELAEIAMPNT